MALPPGALQPLQKRPSLEKSSGPPAVFSPSMFHYQQALANMQLQQPAFIPTGLLKAPAPLAAEGHWERHPHPHPHPRYLSVPGLTGEGKPQCLALHCYVGHDPRHQCSFCRHSRLQSVDPVEVLSADLVELQCVPVEPHFCPVPKLPMASSAVALNPVSL
ncbi:hypothetical protein COCON_G00053020 [Conger conger]|uniref:Uncharacterized protein n=1 Tax=Conger conger TaxID=82655 RepID=A0A9Q1DW06_CONCO|nr:hypothetical protein COCON_G00053020 [Conger conger]